MNLWYEWRWLQEFVRMVYENVESNVNRTEMILYICINRYIVYCTLNTVHKHKYYQQAPHDKSIKILLPGSDGRNVLFFRYAAFGMCHSTIHCFIIVTIVDKSFCQFSCRSDRKPLRHSSSHRWQCHFSHLKTHTHIVLRIPYCKNPM